MKKYAAQCQAAGAPQAGEAPFFVNRDGTPLAARTVSNAFARLRQAAGVARSDGGRYQPRLHVLRHSFAVNRRTAWHRQGKDAQRLLPTYLGHTSVAAIQVYLEMTPELLRAATLRFERHAAGGKGADHG